MFRVYLRTMRLNDFLRVDNIMASSYVARCSRNGQPIRSLMHDDVRSYRLIDVVARARADGLALADPHDPQLLVDLSAERQELTRLRAEKEQVSRELAEHRHQLETIQIDGALSTFTFLRDQEIAALAQPMPPLCGVYFLVHRGHVVYVGQSVNIVSRIAAHTDKRFDAVAYLPCSRDQLDVIESMYIHMLRPALNGRLTGRNSHVPAAPLSMDRLMQLMSRAHRQEVPA